MLPSCFIPTGVMKPPDCWGMDGIRCQTLLQQMRRYNYATGYKGYEENFITKHVNKVIIFLKIYFSGNSLGTILKGEKCSLLSKRDINIFRGNNHPSNLKSPFSL